jgi:hypothetical protein
MKEAQARLERRNQGRLERLIELAPDGHSQALTWSFVIDGSSDAGPNGRTVRLPLLTLFPPMAARVTEARLDLNVAVERAPASQKKPFPSHLRLRICRRAASLRHRIHQLTVQLTGTQDVAAEVSLDGVHLKTVSASPQCEEPNSSVAMWALGQKTT